MIKRLGSAGIEINFGAGTLDEIKRLKAMPLSIKLALRKRIQAMGIDIRNDSIRSMRKTLRVTRYKAGLSRRKGKAVTFNWMRGGKVHIPSSPGNPPAVDTGDLVRSIKVDTRQGMVLTDFEVEVGSNISKPPYPRWLEEGTKRMKPRPWLWPAVMRADRKFGVGIRSTIEQAIRRAK